MSQTAAPLVIGVVVIVVVVVVAVAVAAGAAAAASQADRAGHNKWGRHLRPRAAPPLQTQNPDQRQHLLTFWPPFWATLTSTEPSSRAYQLMASSPCRKTVDVVVHVPASSGSRKWLARGGGGGSWLASD